MSVNRAKLIGLCALIAVFALVVVGTLPASPPSGHRGPANANAGERYAPFVPGELLIKFKTGTGPNERANIRAQLAAQKVREFRNQAQHWKMPAGRSVEHAIAGLRNNPHVSYAEPNYIVELNLTPDDPRYPELWGLNNTGQTGGTPGADIDAERAWNVSTGSHDVVVAVIDTGIDYNHPDLAANAWTNPGEIPGNGMDDDGNGFIDDVHGYDFINNDGDPFDDNGHGTHVSGTIGGVGNDSNGVVGVNWDVTIVGLKFLSAGGTGSTADAVAAIDYATMLGVDIMSNSWGGGGFSQTLLDSIDAAGAADIVFVAAAGNSGSDTDVTPHYPSSYDSPNIIAVMATDHNDDRSIWPSGNSSSWGATTVDIAAPGTDILSTTPGNTYSTFDGTSMATPHVAGAAALVRSIAPDIGVAELKNLLMNLSDPVPALAGLCVSGGRLNAFFPIAEPDDIPPGMIDDLAVAGATSNSLFVEWTATGDDGDVGTASEYDLRYSTSPIDDTNFDIASAVSGEPVPGPSGTPESMEVLGLDPAMTYYLAIKAKDEWGNTGPISNLAFGDTLLPPTFASSPASFTSDLFTGQSETQTLTLQNAGVGTLDWRIPLPEVSGPVAVQQSPLPLQKGEADPRVGAPVVDGFGGPDAFGYRWIDSDEPGGPVFSWTDISMTGTPITELDGDDELSDSIPLGFEVSFYGNTYDSVRVSTNGWLSFTSTVVSGSDSYSNQPLPTNAGPENSLAPFWDDLHFRGATRAAWTSDGSSFVVQYTDVDRYTTGSNLTFQVEVNSLGEVHYRYHTVAGILNDSTVGIQNATKDDGLTVAFNTDYLHDGLEVRIAAVPQWLIAAPTSGRLFAGESIDVSVTFDASGLDGGSYEGSINVETNDPMNPVVGHPATLNVTGAPAIDASPDPVDFGTVFAGFPHTQSLQISNTGTDVLTVTDILSGDPRVAASPSSFSLPARSSQEVEVAFTPAVPGVLSTTLTVLSDASNAPTLVVGAIGVAIPAPDIIVDPTSLSETLFSGNSVVRSLNVLNAGGSDLVIDAFADLGDGSGLVSSGGIGIEGAGGPDGFGYRWRDSDEAGGPVFNWIDIVGVGTPIPFTGDDQNSGPFPLPFSFTFYGNTFTEFRASTNGWLSFTNSTTDFSNDPLPSATGPENLLAPFWDDLTFTSSGDAYYHYDGTKFIISYVDAPRLSSGGPYTFQVLLYPNGKIVYQYLSMAGTRLDEATIGIQNDTRDIGLQVAYNEDYVHDNLAVEMSRTPDWLAVSPPNAVIPPGGSTVFDVTFDATDRPGGVLNGNVVLQTNIPETPEVSVPAELTVIGAPQVTVTPQSYDFGTVFAGYPHFTTFQVTNEGTDVLNVSDILSTDPELFIGETPAGEVIIPEAGFVLVPGGSRQFTLIWSPSVPRTLAAEVQILSDDPDDPTLTMPVSGVAIPAPVAAWSPSSFTESLFVGDIVTRTLHLENQGGSDLEFDTSVRLLGGTPQTAHPPLELKKGEPDPRPGALGSGGPDMFGNTWTDSDEPGGPTFNWVDISSTGTQISFTSQDDSVSDAVPLGMSFPFYGNDFAEIFVSTNGWAAFTDQSNSDLSNDPLPSSGGPRNLLAMFWDDLHMRSTGRVHYLNDGTRFILQYTDVERFSAGSMLTFQAILHPTGRIVFQYLSVSGTLDSSTVGIQNEARDDALQVVYNSDYLHDNLAVEFRPPFEFLSVSPASGTVPPGGFVDLDVTINTSDLIGGDYFASLDLLTNDPANGFISVPVTMHIVGFPAIAADPDAVDFGTVFVGVTSDLDVEISNPGTDVLNVSNITISGDYSTDTTPFSLAVGETRTLGVTFAPTTDGTRTGDLILESNATGMPALTVPLTGEGLFPPEIYWDPQSIETALPPNGSKTKTVELCNNGGSDMLWDAQIDLASSAVAGESIPWTELPKGDESDAGAGIGIERAGGPDAFGYQFKDSDELGGPVFDWVDISTTGTPVSFPSSDDGQSGAIALGMDFPFYGNSFNELYVSTNGWAAFTQHTSSDFSNDPLPSSFGPRNLLALFWDDLHLRNGDARYLFDGSRFILQFTDVGRFSPSTGQSYTYQVHLYPDGRIVYQYLSMIGTLNSATIGIQNDDRTIALEVSFAEDYLHDNLAVEIFRTPDWLTVAPNSGVIPAGECTDLTLSMNSAGLADGDWEASLLLLSNDPFNPLVEVPVLLHVGYTDLTYISIEPNTLNLSSNGKTIRAALQLPEMYDPHDVVIETVSIFGQLFANPAPIGFEDGNGDGVDELIVKFDREAFEALVPESDDVPVTVTGEVQDTTWFTGTDSIRTIRPNVTSPNGTEYLITGQSVDITWNPPAQLPAESYTVWLSRDGGGTWEELATGVTGTSYTWTVEGAVTTAAIVRVFALDNRGVMGYDTSDADFTIAGNLFPPNAAQGLELERVGGDAVLQWKRPATDLQHGPASHYRILRASSPQGPWSEIATPTVETLTEPLGGGNPGQVFFYRIVATNAAGEAAP